MVYFMAEASHWEKERKKGGSMGKERGFTLLELLIVVIILGVLAGLAIPQYTKTVERAKQNEAIHWLGVVRESELRYQQQEGLFTAVLGNLDVDIPPTSTTGPNYFTYSVPTATSSNFTIQATRTTYKKPPAPTVPDGYTVTITEAGAITRQF